MYIPAVESPKTPQHCLGKGYLPHTEGQQRLQHFILVEVTQKVAGAKWEAMEKLLVLGILHPAAANCKPGFTKAGSYPPKDGDAT